MELVKVGIIGPRSYSIGGHDVNNTQRSDIREVLITILQDIQTDENVLLGITGLQIGIEQDFAISCKECNIDYMAVLPFNHQEDNWENITEVKRLYEELLEGAIETTIVNEGGYAPKKIIQKDNKIIEMSDIIVSYETPFKKISTDKEIILINDG